MTRETRHTDADSVLSSADDAVAALRVILETEDEPRQHLGVHVGQAIGPHALDGVARACREAATFTHLKCRLQRDGQRPAGSMAGDVGLVNPGTRKIEAGGQLAGQLLEVGAGASIKALGRHALQHDILHAAFTAQQALLLAVAVLVHHQTVWLDDVERGQEVQHAVPLVDVSLLDVADGLHHEQALTLAIERLVPLEALNGPVAADAHIQVAIL